MTIEQAGLATIAVAAIIGIGLLVNDLLFAAANRRARRRFEQRLSEARAAEQALRSHTRQSQQRARTLAVKRKVDGNAGLNRMADDSYATDAYIAAALNAPASTDFSGAGGSFGGGGSSGSWDSGGSSSSDSSSSDGSGSSGGGSD